MDPACPGLASTPFLQADLDPGRFMAARQASQPQPPLSSPVGAEVCYPPALPNPICFPIWTEFTAITLAQVCFPA